LSRGVADVSTHFCPRQEIDSSVDSSAREHGKFCIVGALARPCTFSLLQVVDDGEGGENIPAEMVLTLWLESVLSRWPRMGG
jgi:hypothetical protein